MRDECSITHLPDECSNTQLPRNEGIEETVSAHMKDHYMSTSYRPNDSEDSSKTITHTFQEKASLSVSHSSSVNLSQGQPKYFKSKPTKINRAFMLRQQLNTKTNGQNLPQNRNTKPISTLESGISRFEAGRHSAKKPKGKNRHKLNFNYTLLSSWSDSVRLPISYMQRSRQFYELLKLQFIL